MEPIDALFNNMDNWRHYPNYQLERRADIFFSIFLPEILYHKVGFEIEGVIPEFPIRIGEIHRIKNINKSFKIDYVAKASKEKRVFLIELKTDDTSRRSKQDWYLQRSKEVGFETLLEGVKRIYQATDYKKKYDHLLGGLEKLGFISVGPNRSIQIIKAEYKIEVVYIQPNVSDNQELSIGFNEIANIVEKRQDSLSVRFSQSLRKWAKNKAGET